MAEKSKVSTSRGRIARFLFQGAILAACGWYIFAQMDWEILRSVRISWGRLAAAVMLHFAYIGIYILLWYYITLKHDVAIPLKRTMSLWAYSLVGKYIPTKIAMVLLRFWGYRENNQNSRGRFFLCIYLEWFLALYTGLLAAVCLSRVLDIPLPVSGFRTMALIMLIGLLPFIYPAVLNRLLAVLFRLLRRESAPPRIQLSLKELAGLVMGYTFAWGVLGLSLYNIIRSVTIDSPVGIPGAILVYTLAGALGIVSIVTPAGLGVRDGAMVFLLKIWHGGSVAVVITVVARLTATAVEFAAAGIAWITKGGIKQIMKEKDLKDQQNENKNEEHPLKKIVNSDLCIGCGICTVPPSDNPIALQYNKNRDMLTPEVDGKAAADSPAPICPGREMDMVQLSQTVHRTQPEDYLIGVYDKIRVMHAADNTIRKRSASGGAVTAILHQLFENGMIDVAYTLVPGKTPYEAKGRIIRTKEQIEGIQGSCYHPFDFGYQLPELLKEDSRFALVGLPCQIAGLEMIKKNEPSLAERHIISIGLFCGGVNRFAGIDYYIRKFGVRLEDTEQMDYRSGNWPGHIRLEKKSTGETVKIPRIKGNSRWKILSYIAAFQGYWMLPRCRMCPDQLSDFADISVGDPHVKKYRNQESDGFSLVISRTAAGESLIQEMINQKTLLTDDDVDAQVVVNSQGHTLDNRRHSAAYIKVARKLRIPVPTITYYPAAEKNISFRHYKWAVVDLLKIKLRNVTVFRPLYPLTQAFEYLFVSFYPSLFFKRLKKLLSNRGS